MEVSWCPGSILRASIGDALGENHDVLDAATWLEVGAGFALLFVGGEGLVRGASRLARRLGISPLVVGLTVVAFGTSAPELLVSATAVLEGRDQIAVGNAVGSNIFNVLVILGLCALVRPLVVAQQLVFRDIPVMIAVSVLLLLFGLDGRVGVGEGLLLCAGAIAFTVDSVRASRRESAEIRSEHEASLQRRAGGRSALADAGLVAVGFALLVLGARWLVSGAVVLAQALGFDETVIALTIVAAGTSLPEVATSLVATLRGERDIAVGNVVGSCIFNVLAIVGVSSVLTGRGIAVPVSIENFDLPVMVAVSVACVPILVRGHRLGRWVGALFVCYYAAYTSYLVLAAREHAALARFSAIMLEFVVPLTVATLIALALARRERPPAEARGEETRRR
jgi:cation:H+ antiporter